MRMVPPRDRAPCDTPSSTRPLACGCCRLAAFDAITRQQRPALGRVAIAAGSGGRDAADLTRVGYPLASRGTERALTISSSQARHAAGTRGARRWLLSVGCARRATLHAVRYDDGRPDDYTQRP